MAIGVQNTNAALIALQTLGRLNDPASADQAGATPPSSTSASVSVATPSVIAGGAIQSLDQTSASLDRASSITDAALSAGQSVSDLLSQLKSLAGQVQGGAVSGDAANSGYAGLLQQITAAVGQAGFDGVNLLDGSSTPSVTIGAGSGQVTLQASDLSLGGSVITLGAASSLSTASAAAGVIAGADTSLANLSQALGQIGDQSRLIAAHSGFVARLSDVLSLGDASSSPSSVEDAQLMALQVQQSLASQGGGGIANASPNVLLSLFK